MAYRINGKIKDGNLILDPPKYLSPFEKVSCLGMGMSEIELIPLDTLFWEMYFFKGIYKREYEEVHYLNSNLNGQYSSYLCKVHSIEPSVSLFADDLNRTSCLIDQMSLPQWAHGDNYLAKEHLDSIEATRNAAAGLGSISESADLSENFKLAATLPQALSNWESITRAATLPQTLSNLDSFANGATISQALSDRDFISQATKIPNPASLNDAGSSNPYEKLLERVPEISSFEHREVHSNNFMNEHYEHIRKENARLEEKEKARDKLQREQVELTAQHLKLNAEQFEVNKRVQAQQDKTEKKIFWLTVFVAGVTTLGFLVTAIGLFFDTKEVRSLFSNAWDGIADLLASAKASFEAFASSLSADDVDDKGQ